MEAAPHLPTDLQQSIGMTPGQVAWDERRVEGSPTAAGSVPLNTASIVACGTCDQLHVRDGWATCTKHRGDKPCLNLPRGGSKDCIKHSAFSDKREIVECDAKVLSFAEGKISRLMKQCELPTQHPLDGLLEVVRRSGAMMRLFGGLVGELDTWHDDGPSEDDPFARPITLMGLDELGHPVMTWRTLIGPDKDGEQAAHILIKLYGEWQDRYAKACKLALDANIDERIVRNAEATSHTMFRALNAALEAAALSPVQRGQLLGTLAAELRKVDGAYDLPASAVTTVREATDG